MFIGPSVSEGWQASPSYNPYLSEYHVIGMYDIIDF